jgi:hypothetical protein
MSGLAIEPGATALLALADGQSAGAVFTHADPSHPGVPLLPAAPLSGPVTSHETPGRDSAPA